MLPACVGLDWAHAPHHRHSPTPTPDIKPTPANQQPSPTGRRSTADFQTIVSKGISENLLVWKGIEATERLANSHNSKAGQGGGGGGGEVEG